MIKVMSIPFEGKEPTDVSVPDISQPITLMIREARVKDMRFQPAIKDKVIDVEFYDPTLKDTICPPHCRYRLGSFLRYETYLEIDGKEYRYDYIHDHVAEVTALINNAVARQLIEEITDD